MKSKMVTDASEHRNKNFRLSLLSCKNTLSSVICLLFAMKYSQFLDSCVILQVDSLYKWAHFSSFFSRINKCLSLLLLLLLLQLIEKVPSPVEHAPISKGVVFLKQTPYNVDTTILTQCDLPPPPPPPLENPGYAPGFIYVFKLIMAWNSTFCRKILFT